MFENILLISSAGSGKTRELTKQFLIYYLSEENSHLKSLYAVTFTNEAAYEMKSRILHYLNILSGRITEDKSEKEILEEFKKIFPDIRERAKEKKKYLLHNISDLNISTFHSLFSSFLSSIPFFAGVIPGYGIIEEGLEKIMFEEIVDKFFEETENNEEILKNIQELIEYEEISNLKKRIIKVYQSISPYIDFLEKLLNKEEKLKIELEKCKKNFWEIFKKLKDFLEENISEGSTQEGKINKYFSGFLEKMKEFLEEKDFDKFYNDKISENILNKKFLEKRYIENFLKNISFEKSKLFLEIFEKLRENLQNCLYLLSDTTILVYLKPVLEIHKKFQNEKKEKNVLGFTDIEKYTLNALKNNPETDYLYFKIGSEIKHLMIDEFQDTNFLQMEVLEPIISELTSVSPSEKSIFCVGDPSQAIFRFRGGVAKIFDFLKNKYSEKIKVKTLNINYRSKEEIINFVNKIFERNDKTEENNKGGWIRVENLGDFQNKEEGKERILKRISEIVQELHNNYGYKYSEIAVLTKRNNFAMDVSEELSNSDIPWQSRSGKDILNDNDVRFILNLLKFLDEPENDFALFSVLNSPVFGINEETIREMKKEGKTLYLALTKSYPFLPLTQKLKNLLSLSGFLNPYEIIYQIYKEFQFEISYPLLTLLDIALEYTKEGFHSLSSFIRWVESVGATIEIKQSHSEGVNILTVHKAKGLEFEVVIIPETDYTPEKENKNLLFSYTEDETKPEKIYWRKYTKYLEDLKNAERERLENDELNILYVAMTRAKNGLYILGYTKEGKAGFLFDFISKKIGDGNYVSGEIIKKEIKTEKEKRQKYYQIKEENFETDEEYFLYSPTEESDEFMIGEKYKGLEFGEIVHKALSYIEWMDGLNTEKVVTQVIGYVKNIYTKTFQEEKEMEKNLNFLLFETITDPQLRFLFFKDNRNVECRNELPIYFTSEKKEVSARIDRIIIEGNKIIIADYKIGERKEEYRKQIETYKKGVQKIYPEREIEAVLVYLGEKKGKKLEII